MKKFLKKYGMYCFNMRFFADDADANGSDANGGGQDDGNGGGGGKPAAGNDTPPAGQTVELTVDGEKRQVTLEEAKNLAQKAAAADKKFQEASEMRKQAADGLRIKELYTRFSDPDHTPTDEEIKEFATFMNISAEELMNKIDDTPEPTPKPAPAGQGSSNFDFDAEFQKRFGRNPAEVKAQLDYNNEQNIENAKRKIRDYSDNMVDKDEIFGKIIIGEDDDVRKNRLEVIKDMVSDEVLRKILDGKNRDTATAESIQKVRSYLTKFGISGKPDQHPISLGLAPGEQLPTEVTSDKPIGRIAATEEGAEANFVNRYAQKALQALRGNKNR